MTTTQASEQALLIGGEWTAARSGETFEQVDPYTGETVGSAAAATREDARAPADAAGEAFAGWSQTPPGRRRELLQGAAALLTERAHDIAGVVTAATGGPLGRGKVHTPPAAG